MERKPLNLCLELTPCTWKAAGFCLVVENLKFLSYATVVDTFYCFELIKVFQPCIFNFVSLNATNDCKKKL
jgi:hypothetical protein